MQEDKEYTADEDKQEEDDELLVKSEEALLSVEELIESNSADDKKKLKKSKINVETTQEQVCMEKIVFLHNEIYIKVELWHIWIIFF